MLMCEMLGTCYKMLCERCIDVLKEISYSRGTCKKRCCAVCESGDQKVKSYPN